MAILERNSIVFYKCRERKEIKWGWRQVDLSQHLSNPEQRNILEVIPSELLNTTSQSQYALSEYFLPPDFSRGWLKSVSLTIACNFLASMKTKQREKLILESVNQTAIRWPDGKFKTGELWSHQLSCSNRVYFASQVVFLILSFS